MTKFLLRSGLILSAVTAGILNGSVLAAPILIFMAYLLSVLVQKGQEAVTLYEEERLRAAKNHGIFLAENARLQFAQEGAQR